MKKITDFGDGGVVQTGDKFLIARSGSNYTIDGSAIANTIANVATLQSGQLTLSANVSNTANAVAALQANVTLNSNTVAMLQANVASNGAAIIALQSNVALLQANGTGGSGGTGAGTANLTNTGVAAGTYTLATTKGFTVDSYGRLTNVAVASHKAWRLRVDHTGSSPADAYCSLAELQFRTTPGTAQQATGGTAFSSATGNGATAGQAFDNDVGDRWVASYPSTGMPKYVGYIYAAPISVAEMMIAASSGYPSETPTVFALECSDDTTTGLDGSWIQATAFSTPATWAASETRLFAVSLGAADQTANVVALQSNVANLSTNVVSLSSRVTSLEAHPSSGGSTGAGGPGPFIGGTFDFADADGSLVFSDLVGCTVTRPSAGVYNITFTTPMADAHYGVVATGKWDGNNAQHAGPGIAVDRETNSLPTINGFTLVSINGFYDCRVTFLVFPNAASLLSGGGGSSVASYPPFSPPKVADFTDTTSAVAAGAFTLADDTDLGLLISLPPVNGNNVTGIFKSLPTSGDWTVSARILSNNLALNYGALGLTLLDVAGNTAQIFGPDISRYSITVCNYYPKGGYNNQPLLSQTMSTAQWLRISYSASNTLYTYQISNNGKLWSTVYTQAGSNFTKIGLGVATNQTNVAGYVIAMEVPYWKQSF